MNEQFYIGFGSGIKLLSEDWYIKEMGANITKKAFRSFCRALQVPLIEIGKATFIEMNSFQLALKAITRIGEPDFYVSGCLSIASGKQRPSKLILLMWLRILNPSFASCWHVKHWEDSL